MSGMLAHLVEDAVARLGGDDPRDLSEAAERAIAYDRLVKAVLADGPAARDLLDRIGWMLLVSAGTAQSARHLSHAADTDDATAREAHERLGRIVHHAARQLLSETKSWR